MNTRWNLWVWEQPSWRVIASYDTREEALQAARHAADPPDTWKICAEGLPRDEIMRANCTRRDANRL